MVERAGKHLVRLSGKPGPAQPDPLLSPGQDAGAGFTLTGRVTDLSHARSVFAVANKLQDGGVIKAGSADP